MSLNRSILATALTGASGVGGTLIYHHAVPWTWKEVLIKDGCYFLNEDNEYKAVWSEHKTSLKNIKDLKSNEETFNKGSMQNWCESQLKNNYSKDPTSYANISNLCTNKGITTVKAILILSGYGGFIVDEVITEKEPKKRKQEIDNLYKIAFGIYRYYPQFITWITEFSRKTPKNPYSTETIVGEGGEGLESACVAELNRPHKEISDINYYTQISWWCKKFKYKNVHELILSKEPDWELDKEVIGKAEKWRNTPLIKQSIPKTELTNEIEDSNIRSWCKTSYELDLYDNAAYMQIYRIVKYVCKKEKPKSQKNVSQ